MWIQHSTRLLARISTQLYTGIGAAVALTFVASLVAWLAFDRVGDAQTEVNETSLPQLAGSFAVAQQGSALAVAATRLTSAATPEELADIEASIQKARQAFEIQLSTLTRHSGERFDRVRIQGGALITNIDAIEKSANQRFALRETSRGPAHAVGEPRVGVRAPTRHRRERPAGRRRGGRPIALERPQRS